MTGERHHSIRAAAALRDAATARIRRTTAAIVALATCLTAAFTALAASSTHARRASEIDVRPRTRHPARWSRPHPALVPVARPTGAQPRRRPFHGRRHRRRRRPRRRRPSQRSRWSSPADREHGSRLVPGSRHDRRPWSSADADALPRARRLLEQEVELPSTGRAAGSAATASLRSPMPPPGVRSPSRSCSRRRCEVALHAARDTDGLVDPTLGVQLRAAGYDRTFALVLGRGSWTVRASSRTRGSLATGASSTWRAASSRCRSGSSSISARPQRHSPPTVRHERSPQQPARGTIVSLGGDIAVAGRSPSGGWCVGIADDHRAPLDDAGPRVLLAAGGLATSSTSVRSWPTDLGLRASPSRSGLGLAGGDALADGDRRGRRHVSTRTSRARPQSSSAATRPAWLDGSGAAGAARWPSTARSSSWAAGRPMPRAEAA